MSIGLCGYIDFSSGSLSDKISLSYFIVEQSSKYRLGCKLGGNVSHHAYTILENDATNTKMFMEIMDTPLDNYANDMFHPNINTGEDSEVDIVEQISLNLFYLQGFLQSIINYKKVNGITLYFNYEFLQNEDKTVDISICDFSDIMLDYYSKNDYFAPALKIIIDGD